MDLNELRDGMYELEFGEDEVEFYYHLTQEENAHGIMEKGLFLPDYKLSSGAIKIEQGFYDDPESYIDFELGNPQTRRKEVMMIITRYDALAPKYDDSDIIQVVDEGDKELYLIPAENILGYVDLERKDFTVNPASEISIGTGLSF